MFLFIWLSKALMILIVRALSLVLHKLFTFLISWPENSKKCLQKRNNQIDQLKFVFYTQKIHDIQNEILYKIILPCTIKKYVL